MLSDNGSTLAEVLNTQETRVSRVKLQRETRAEVLAMQPNKMHWLEAGYSGLG